MQPVRNIKDVMVFFPEDSKYILTNRRNIKIKNNRCLAKYGKYGWYEACVINVNDSKLDLTTLMTALTSRFPAINLWRCDRTLINQISNNVSCSTIDKNMLVEQGCGGIEYTCSDVTVLATFENPIINPQKIVDVQVLQNDEFNKASGFGDTRICVEDIKGYDIPNNQTMSEHNTSEHMHIFSAEMDIQNENEHFTCDIAEFSVHHVNNNSRKHEANRSSRNSQGTNTKWNCSKKHCCLFCKKLIFKPARHYMVVHKNEAEIKEISKLDIRDPLRREKLKKLRIEGDYRYNILNEQKISLRKQMLHDTSEYCPGCKGLISKQYLRQHTARCKYVEHSYGRSLQPVARSISHRWHENASEILGNKIIAFMRDDEVTNSIRFDECVILYGNNMCRKLCEEHNYDQIRSHMRLLGRLLIIIKNERNDVSFYKDLMTPGSTDYLISGIDTLAHYNKSERRYKNPTNASTLGTCLKKMISFVGIQAIKDKDKELQEDVKNLLQLFENELNLHVNRIASESLSLQKRRKTTNLPSTDEVGRYITYLYNQLVFYKTELEKRFTTNVWLKLAQYTLIVMVVFNRKRPGETQRVEIEDFNCRQVIDPRDTTLSSEERRLAGSYARMRFRGKLNNPTSLLLETTLVIPAVELLLKHRYLMDIPQENKFVFGVPHHIKKKKTLEAYTLHSKFVIEAGCNPELMTTTLLRKHFATEVSKENLDYQLELQVSNFMSHAYNIHKRIYDQTSKTHDIIKVSRHLERHSLLNSTNIRSNETNEEGGLLKTIDSSVNSSFNNENNIHNLLENSSISDPDYQLSSEEGEENEEYAFFLEKHAKTAGARLSWSEEEQNAASYYFSDEIEKDTEVSIRKVHMFKNKYSNVLQNRSPNMIKQWVKKRKEKLNRLRNGIEDKNRRYSNFEKSLIRSEILESTSELGGTCNPQKLALKLLQNYPEIFKGRTESGLAYQIKLLCKNH